jgi:hypothetical protein
MTGAALSAPGDAEGPGFRATARDPQTRGGGGGIRTHGPRERTPVFKTGVGPISTTSPRQSHELTRRRGFRWSDPESRCSIATRSPRAPADRKDYGKPALDRVTSTDVVTTTSKDHPSMITDPSATDSPQARPTPATRRAVALPAGHERPPSPTRERQPITLPPAARTLHDDPDAGLRQCLRDAKREDDGTATERRRDVRLPTPPELFARIWSDTGMHGPAPILSLSARGMLLFVEDLAPTQIVRFELIGRAWRFAGRAHVVDRGARSVALSILAWDGNTQARVHEFVTRRLLP